jgi:hypothetical protein
MQNDTPEELGESEYLHGYFHSLRYSDCKLLYIMAELVDERDLKSLFNSGK